MNSFIDCYLLDISELKSESIYRCTLNILPEIGLWKERKKRIMNYKKKEDKFRGVGAGLLIKHFFDINHIKYECLRKNEYGKLYIDRQYNMKFNISHSGAFVVFTFGSSENGVDIEKLIDGRDLAKRFFTNKENQIINCADEDMFTRIWTLKEAYIKERGKGLNIPLNSFEVHPGRINGDPDSYGLSALLMSENTIIINDLERQYKEFKIQDYYISICSKSTITDRIKKKDIFQLI